MATQAAVVDTEWVPAFSFGDRMRLVRRKKQRSQAQMAQMLGVKKVTYSSWEAGRTPSLEEVQQIARRLYALDRVPQWWTLGADEPPASLWGTAPVAQRIEHLTTDQKVRVPNTSGRAPLATPRRRERRRNSLHVVPLRLAARDGERIPA